MTAQILLQSNIVRDQRNDHSDMTGIQGGCQRAFVIGGLVHASCAHPTGRSLRDIDVCTGSGNLAQTMAFDGGPFGIRILQRLMKDAPRFLRSGGWLGLEVGLGQGPAVQQWLARTGQFGAPLTVLDDHGQVRSLLVQRH